ncbi:hypothetical protein B1757_02045 [Acidithiobacillus marinus]|uniref:Uncharacterized protein n=1 Tax=Acidithiobacillus marinus TaxID=187490 RepID=A0A2I1DQH8_9PROT|nr:hypothetical protein B1757_02045 [Acidithiobacillus marinus]
MFLSACATIQTPAPPHKSPQIDLSALSRPDLLLALHHCGIANSLACTHIHLALANSYLNSSSLNKTTLDNADRELDLAAQNQKLALQTRSLRRVVRALLENQILLQQYKSRLQQSQLQTQTALKEAHTAETRLHQLESLLQHHAEKTLKTPDHRVP